MNIKAYIASGILELYVYGSLSEKENAEVYKMLQQYPEAVLEVERIEKALQQISGAVAPGSTTSIYPKLETRLQLGSDGIVPISQKRNNWPAYIGWAASIVLLGGLFFLLNKNRELQQQIVTNQIEQTVLEGKINVAEQDLSNTKTLLNVLRNKNIIHIELKAQQIDPNAYAAVYWDKDSQTTYIDIAGLPTPPPGKVYQVWSLKLDPLTPTNLGILEAFEENEDKIFTLSNPNQSEAFGITLEPDGGSKSPTLEQLYTLGVVGI